MSADLFEPAEPPPSPPVQATARDIGLGLALNIQRSRPLRDWPECLAAIGNPEHRAVADEYLRGIAARQRVIVALIKGEQP